MVSAEASSVRLLLSGPVSPQREVSRIPQLGAAYGGGALPRGRPFALKLGITMTPEPRDALLALSTPLVVHAIDRLSAKGAQFFQGETPPCFPACFLGDTDSDGGSELVKGSGEQRLGFSWKRELG
jgi:hypothetical protein